MNPKQSGRRRFLKEGAALAVGLAVGTAVPSIAQNPGSGPGERRPVSLELVVDRKIAVGRGDGSRPFPIDVRGQCGSGTEHHGEQEGAQFHDRPSGEKVILE